MIMESGCERADIHSNKLLLHSDGVCFEDELRMALLGQRHVACSELPHVSKHRGRRSGEDIDVYRSHRGKMITWKKTLFSHCEVPQSLETADKKLGCYSSSEIERSQSMAGG